jgi:hypothetical protein
VLGRFQKNIAAILPSGLETVLDVGGGSAFDRVLVWGVIGRKVLDSSGEKNGG